MPRFNLDLLRDPALAEKVTVADSKASGFRISRRSFLTWSGAGLALGALPPFLRGDGFALVRDGARLHFVVGDEARWTIDPADFGDRARLEIDRSAQEITISICEAFFPGTALPADFVCRLRKQRGNWIFHFALDCGIETSSPLLDWLDGRNPALGSWNADRLRPFSQLSVAFDSVPSVRFTPDWVFDITAPSLIKLQGFEPQLSASDFAIVLNSPTLLSGGQAERTTTLIFPRRERQWQVNLRRQDASGWTIDHHPADPLFDELFVQAGHSDGHVLRSAMLSQASDNNAILIFRPGGTLTDDSGEPFAIPLHKPRLAFSLDDEPHSSLLADLPSESVWAHDANASYRLSVSPDAPRFELHEGPDNPGAPQVSPGICEICFPNDDVCMNLKLGVPRPVPFTWADFFAPLERFVGWLHLLPSQLGKLVIDLEKGDLLSIDRPRDLLSLQFQFENMRLVTGIDPHIEHVRHKGTSTVKVIFPPQHAAEQAFFHSDDSGITTVDVPIGNVERDDYAASPANPNPALAQLKKKYDPEVGLNSSESDLDMPGIKLSGPTRLVFTLPNDYEIPCETEALLHWDDWVPHVVPVAQSNVDTHDPQHLPPIIDPGEEYTSIELPFSLNLSPSNLGAWVHSATPVESHEKVVELWHTRLAVKSNSKKQTEDGSKHPPDETNSKDRIVRAVWSPDFVPVPLNDQSCTMTPPSLLPPHFKAGDPPFRMSLDGRDHCELVHLTSNYSITQQKHFCDNGQILPTDPRNLLPPAPVEIDRLMLTAMGGYLEAFGQWNPSKIDMNNQLTVQMWKHSATLGRDHYVKIVYKGYLAPLGLRASLVKVTQRVFSQNSGKNWVAILHQHMYIIVKNERKQCPIMGQPFAGRAFPFSFVEPITLTTPFLNDPSKQHWPTECSTLQTQSLFWPTIPAPAGTAVCGGSSPDPPGVVFSFRLRFTDITGTHLAEASMPLLFVASDVAQTDGFGAAPNFKTQDAVRFYNAGSRAPASNADDPYISADFGGQKLSFAASSNPGDTAFEVGSIGWRAVSLVAKVSGKLIHVQQGATITFRETASGTQYVVVADGSGSYSLVIDSGIYVITVATPQPAPNPPLVVTTPPLPFPGNWQYTLDLALAADFKSFSPAPGPVQTKQLGPSAIDLYHYDLPFFYPAVDYARITSTSIKRISGGNTAPTKFAFSGIYLSDGFNTKTNVGEVILEKSPDDRLELSFGAAGNVDKAGGLSSPDVLVAGISRKRGPVGGKTTTNASGRATLTTSVTTYSSGKFDPADFFGGLLSAKLLGAVKLSDIIAPLASGLASNLAKAPQMLEQALFAAERYTLDAARVIDKFQSISPNPLATALSLQAQKVADARTALASASGSDPITQGVLEGELVARIADYTGALGHALQNPLSLIEDAILQLLTQAVASILGTLNQALIDELNALANLLNTALDQQLQTILGALDALQSALDTRVQDLLTLGQQADTTLDQMQRIADLAPDLKTVLEIRSLVLDLNGSVKGLGNAISGIATQHPSLEQFPQISSNLNRVLTDLQQIYQKGGFLGVVVAKATAGSALAARIATAQKALLDLWKLPDYSQYANDIATLEENCIKLASSYPQKEAQQILQNLRQLQAAVNKAITYRVAANVPANPQTLYRQLQLLQKMQANILGALASLQSLAKPPAGASPSVQQAAADLAAALPQLANHLTVAAQLLNNTAATTIDQLIAPLTTDADTIKTLAASAADLQNQFSQLRAQIASDPLNLALQLLHYNLSIDYQRPLATALSYIAYLQATADAALNNLANILGDLEKLAVELQKMLCVVQGVWKDFTDYISTLLGPNKTDVNMPLGKMILSLFQTDLDAIDAAFKNLCDPAQIAPSQFLHNGQQVIASFTKFVEDIRSKIPSLSAIEAALTDAIKEEAEQLLASLLSDVPIPTSINLGYTWKPDIQSFEPVFVLNDGASFEVLASAQAGLNSQLSGITASFDIRAKLQFFSINLIGESPFITLVIRSLAFTSHNGAKPDCRLELTTVKFGDQMKFVQDLADLLDPSEGPFIELAADAIRAGFRFAIESMTLGAFNLMQLAIEVAVALPFDGTPVRCEIGISDQQHPFLLSAGIYGGGGFLQLQLGLDGVQLLQGAFEFGVCAAISIGPLQGSGFVVAGIYFRITANSSEVCGFVHAHGHMDIFGIISIDVDLYVAVCYLSGSVQGIATFSVSVSIGFFSESFSMQAQYSFGGSGTADSDARLIDVPVETAEAYLLSPSRGGPMAMDDTPVAVGSGQRKSDAPSTCPETSQAPLFVNPAVWKVYYNSFV